MTASTLLLLIGMATPLWALETAEISGFAFVQQDASLRVSGYVVHLHGIYIPPTEQAC